MNFAEWAKTSDALTFDTETTGVDPREARVVTAALVRVRPDGSVVWQREWLINPGVEIPEGATAVHGITNEQVQANGMHPVEALTELVALLEQDLKECPLVIYNAKYDWTLLQAECARHGVQTTLFTKLNYTIIDPLVLDRHTDKYRKGKRTLATTAAVYGVTPPEGSWHGATVDALASEGVARKLSKRPFLAVLELADLMRQQTLWHRAWATSYSQYRVSQQGLPALAPAEFLWPLTEGFLWSPAA